MADYTETTLDTKPVFEGRTLKIRLDTVRLPNGETSTREIVQHRGSVCIVAVQNGNLYLVRQYRHATGETLLELPAGTKDGGEDPETCARREIEEEIGMSAKTMTHLFDGYVSPGYTSELQSFFLAEGLAHADAERDDDEFMDVVTIPFADALAAVDRGEYRDSKTVCGVLAAARRLGIR